MLKKSIEVKYTSSLENEIDLNNNYVMQFKATGLEKKVEGQCFVSQKNKLQIRFKKCLNFV